MKLYSDFGGRRAYQIVGDLFAVVVLVVGVRVAVALHDSIASLKGFGRDVARSGGDFRSTMSDIGDTLGGVPLIGGGIRSPFDAASAAGGTLVDAGTRWQDGVEALATLVGWTVAVLVVLVVLLGWIRPRLVGAVRRAAVARLATSAPSLDLLALRALATRPARAVTQADEDAVAGWRRGDEQVIRRLAALELRASGVRLRDD
ncbi:hypothetical protein [Amnibacterium endophyticum]|uniref:Transmembrane protein n=1 Tax=Amnibacterium endophyticum TaxID=2109337 RepID=A0ABW4LIB2_9MICO